MKKLKFVKALSIAVVLLLGFNLLSACGGGHTHSWEDANCLTAKTCTECGVVEGEALGHDWQEATCYNPKECSRCHEKQGLALDHEFGEWYETEPATCDMEGEKRHDCTRCDYYETRMIFALGHSFENGVCTVCGTPEEN